jgi:hypothetical protein
VSELAKALAFSIVRTPYLDTPPRRSAKARVAVHWDSRTLPAPSGGGSEKRRAGPARPCLTASSPSRGLASKRAPQDARRAGPHAATANHRQYVAIIKRLVMLMTGSRPIAGDKDDHQPGHPMHVGDARPRRNWRKQPRPNERDPNKPQASCTQTSASGRGVRRDDLREEHRANAEAAERQRHQPAVAAQLVFADEVSRVELWLEAMQDGKEAQERGHQPEGQARPNQGGLPSHSFRVAQFGCYVLFEGQNSRGRRNEVDAAGFPRPARAYTGPDSHYGSPVGRRAPPSRSGPVARQQ